jgi:mono/diheme cytochrome c family protein
MPVTFRTSLLTLGAVLGVAIAATAGFVWSGMYDIGADAPHSRPVFSLLQSLRERSIEARARDLQVPDLEDPARIAQGAGNYDAMCTGCHLMPGAAATEISRGLYPAPPNLTRERVDAAAAFWTIKHGIKASGMPAWGKSMDDTYIWNMVAFVQQLPALDAAGYRALVARSGGHSHGGGESAGHLHAGMADHQAGAHAHDDADGHAEPMHDDAGPSASAPATHVHADGTRHVHAPDPTAAATTAPSPTAAPEPEEHDAHEAHPHQH